MMAEKDKDKLESKQNGHNDGIATGAESSNEQEEIDAAVALEEIEHVNSNLDSLSSFLDAMEQRTDDIKTQLMELLVSSREIRKSIQQEKADDESNCSK